LNTNAAPYRVPIEPGRWRAFALAMLMHLLLLGFLWVGVSWQNTVPVSIEAEIWSPQVRVAAPPAPEPEPAPEPKPVITPPKPQPAPEPQAKMPDPDIALEKEKKRKQELDKKLAEEKQKQEKKRLAEAQEKKKLAELEKQKQLEDQKRKLEEAAEAQRDKARRDNNLKRLQALAGEGTPASTGDAERSSGPKTDANYLGKIAGRIKSNTRFATTDAIPGNPTVEYELELLPDGSVKEIKITRVSGYAAFDEAVKRAIYLSAPFPPDPSSGRVPSSIAARQRLKEN
jgi:colicin import membrane protein